MKALVKALVGIIALLLIASLAPTAMPNDTPTPDTHAKSTIESTVKKDDKPKKDWWDKADIVGKFLIAAITALAAVVIPIAVAIIGGQVQKVLSTQQTGKDYMQIALGILEKKDLPTDMQKNIGLRKWAVDLLNYYSEVKLDDDTANKLVSGEVQIPLVLEYKTEDFHQIFPWNAKDILTIRGPHGGPFASVTTDGVVKLQYGNGYISDPSGIRSPRAEFSRINGELLFVYNNQMAKIYFTQPYTIRGELRQVPPIQITPPNGISQIWLSSDDPNQPIEEPKTIIVRGTDNKQVRYDLDGNEIGPVIER